ncbi:MAG: hypothetical protein QHJ81_13775 [Anaerolineae bacterium]|nr:hypothetical protein [Anaerolineae bacterium]
MIAEALGVFVCLFLLTFIGLGPALVLLPSGEKRVVYALGMAPTLGLAMVGLIGFSLVRYVAPVRVWAWPFVAFWAVVALGMVVWDRRRSGRAGERGSRGAEEQGSGGASAIRNPQSAIRNHVGVYTVAVALAFVLLCYAVLVSPLITEGIQYTIFRSNPSDAFYYMSLAETVRVADWKTIAGGIELSRSNWEGIKALARASPTALYTARAIGKPLELANPIAFSWAAQVTGIPVHRFYYAYHLLCFALALPLSLVIGDHLGLSRGLKYLAAAAVVLGFWARFVLETDAGYEISAISLFLLVVFAWMQLEGETPRPLSRRRLLLAIACAAMVAFYSPLAIVFVVALLCYYGLGLWQRVKSASAFLYHGLTALLVILIFLLSGQLGYIFRHILLAAFAAPGEARYEATVLGLIRSDGTAALWGLPSSVVFSALPVIAQVPLRILGDALGIGLTAILIAVALILVLRKSAPDGERIALAMLAGAFGLSLVLVVVDNARSAGKALTYVYPWLIFAVVLYPKYMRSHLTAPQQKLAVALLGLWLVAQCLVGAYLPYSQAQGSIFGRSERRKAESYDLSAIEMYLQQAQPELLLVHVPRDKDWTFAYYCMFVFARYPAHFQSGIIIDNSTEFQNLWFEDLTAVPDYTVVLKSVDYIGPGNLGTKVAETADLALYRITTDDVTPFVQAEALWKSEEAAKPPFPTLKGD